MFGSAPFEKKHIPRLAAFALNKKNNNEFKIFTIIILRKQPLLVQIFLSGFWKRCLILIYNLFISYWLIEINYKGMREISNQLHIISINNKTTFQ